MALSSVLFGRRRRLRERHLKIEVLWLCKMFANFAGIKARFTRQLFWHGTRLNLAPVPKICGPAPFIFVV